MLAQVRRWYYCGSLPHAAVVRRIPGYSRPQHETKFNPSLRSAFSALAVTATIDSNGNDIGITIILANFSGQTGPLTQSKLFIQVRTH